MNICSISCIFFKMCVHACVLKGSQQMVVCFRLNTLKSNLIWNKGVDYIVLKELQSYPWVSWKNMSRGERLLSELAISPLLEPVVFLPFRIFKVCCVCSTGRGDGAGENSAPDDQIWPAGGAPLHVPAALRQATQRWHRKRMIHGEQYIIIFRHLENWCVFLLVKGDKNKVCKVLQMAWTFVNDRWAVGMEPLFVLGAVFLEKRLDVTALLDWPASQLAFHLRFGLLFIL